MEGIYAPPPADAVADSLRGRMKRRIDLLSDDALYRYLADAVYLERKRLAAGDADEREAVEAAAKALQKDRAAQQRAVLHLVDGYAREIHNPFSSRTYDVALKVVPMALGRLLGGSKKGSFDPKDRIVVSGETALARSLSDKATLILAPTHVSNLDSPIIGWALHEAGLPPFIYGAGLNLFSNPAMAFLLGRLGAYTVDRRKKHHIYKDALKDYSVDALLRRCHSTFFPGGTRARSGAVETKLKKGLLGTGIEAWQDALASKRADGEVLVVPCTISYALVLEAETLIEDHLAEEGKSRYIISDDEFADARKVASFLSRVLHLDATVHVRFGRPLDLLGNPVDDDGRSLDGAGRVVDRVGYVTDKSGALVHDSQRDLVYTERLADSLCDAYRRDTTVLSTHVAARAAWELLEARNPRLDLYQRLLVALADRTFDRAALLERIERIEERARQTPCVLPTGAEAILDDAVDKFGRFHTRRALDARGDQVVVDPKLCLYYGNRALQVST